MAIRYIFNTSGEYVAFVSDRNLFNPDGDWLGFIVNGNEVYQTDGLFVGYLLDDDRIARKEDEVTRSRQLAPFMPLRPLRPLQPLRRLRMPSLPHPYVDIFEGVRGKITKLTVGPDLRRFEELEGSRLVAADQIYLGRISRNKYDSDSLSNEYGNYGSKYSALSIFNDYGKYGGPYSQLSPFNPYTSTPPTISKDARVIGPLTANPYLQNRVDINDLVFWLGS